MNPDPVYQRLREIGWRRPLTEAEHAELRAWLAAHPEQQAEAQAEAALSRWLAKLPDAPLPSNFTARVLQAIEQDARTSERQSHPVAAPWWRVFIPRIAVAALVLIGGFVAYHRHQQATQRQELAEAAKKLALVAGSGPLADPLILEDYEVIRQMSQADEELLALSDDLLSLKP